MREIPISLLEGFCVALKPYLPNITPAKILPLLYSMRRGPLTLTEMAKINGMSKVTLWRKLKDKGVKPVTVGAGGVGDTYDPETVCSALYPELQGMMEKINQGMEMI